MKIKWRLILLLSLLPVIWLNQPAEAQGAEDEVYLQFRHQGVVNVFVSTLYHEDLFYVSIGELFTSLSIEHTLDSGRLRIDGSYLEKGSFAIQLKEQTATLGSRRVSFPADDFVITDFGFYLVTDLFYELFEMDLSINFSDLSLSLDAPDTMPVVAQRLREVQRGRILNRQREIRREFYPLREVRNTSFLNLGFVDYNLTTSYLEEGAGFNYNTNIGTEFLGGDIQGSILGSYTQTASVFRSTNLRWRYGFANNSLISTIQAGQNRSAGLSPAAFTGVRLTNEPIEPRFLYGETALNGTVFPGADVELYRNNSLIDYTQADASGDYSFSVPVTYGSSQFSIRSFSPGGLQDQRDLRFQIPINFLPAGEVNYTVEGGRLDNPIAGSLERGLMGQGRMQVGISNRLTAGFGAEYFEDFHGELPTFTGSLSTRLFTNHLVTLQAATEAFYRGSYQAIFPSNASISAEYTHYNESGGIYNPGQNTSVFRANLFTPFQIREFPLFFRWSFGVEERELSTIFRYRVDLNTRLGRANLRMGYRDSQLNRMEFLSTPSARLLASATYTFRGVRDGANPLDGLFVRAQMNYIPEIEMVEDAEIQISRSFGNIGRLQLSAGRNFIGNFDIVRFAFTLDFNTFRSSTNVRSTRGAASATQSFRGSVGYDTGNRQALFTNRNQVGQAGIAVRLFVDHNNNGVFDEGEPLIPEQAVRIERASSRTQVRGGINYISQLQAYRQYNLTINKSAISNPLLVPIVERFSFITDPNQFKTIDIPFYTSGIVEGMVYRVRYGQSVGLGGLRLYMVQVNAPEGSEPYREELRTFSDGSFYQFEVPPGDYEIYADQTQLNFLNARAEPERLEVTVRPLSEGDFVEGLIINLVPRDPFDDPPGTDEEEAGTVSTAEAMDEADPEEELMEEAALEQDTLLAEDPAVIDETERLAEDPAVIDVTERLAEDPAVIDEKERLAQALGRITENERVTGAVPDTTLSDRSPESAERDPVAAADERLTVGETTETAETETLADAIREEASTEPEETTIAGEETAITEGDLAAEIDETDPADLSPVFAEELRAGELAEEIIRDPNGERSISDIEIFTQNDNCRFSIQMAEYQTLEEAFSRANRFEQETGRTFRIYSSGPRDPYRIRTPESDSFGEVLTGFNELLSQSPTERPAIITQCQDHEQSGPLRYLIQLGAFSNMANAESLAGQLMDQYGMPSRIDDSDGRLNRVQAGPFQNRQELLEAFRRLAGDNVAPGMYIMADPESYYNILLEYRLQVGLFTNPRDAVRYAFEISEAFEVDTFVIVDGSAFKVMVNKDYEMWDDVFRDFAMISAYDGENTPAIHLLESER